MHARRSAGIIVQFCRSFSQLRSLDSAVEHRLPWRPTGSESKSYEEIRSFLRVPSTPGFQSWMLRGTRPLQAAHHTYAADHSQSSEGTSAEARRGDQGAAASSTSGNSPSESELIAALAEREALMKDKDDSLAEIRDKLLRTLAEMENLRERTKRELDSMKKYAVQDFAKALLDVADNLSRAAAAVPEDFSATTASEGMDTEAAKFLQSLREGVAMTNRQLGQVLTKFGVVQFNPLDEQFDPNKHNALFQIDNPAKEPGTVGVVTKVGYTLHDRVIRPAEVGVVRGSE